MSLKTDNPELVGVHTFEAAGLGKAPFYIVGFGESVYQAHPDAPRQPGTCCDYCGTGIMMVCQIQSSDGRRFKVGSNCVDKTGDEGLMKAYKNRPEYRELQRQKAAAKDERVKAEWAALFADPANIEKLNTIVREGYHGPEGWGAFALRAWGYCGASGRAGYLAQAKKILSGGRTK